MRLQSPNDARRAAARRHRGRHRAQGERTSRGVALPTAAAAALALTATGLVVAPGLSSGVALADSAVTGVQVVLAESVPTRVRLQGTEPEGTEPDSSEPGSAEPASTQSPDAGALSPSQLQTAKLQDAREQAGEPPSRVLIERAQAQLLRERRASLAAAKAAKAAKAAQAAQATQAAKRRADARARASRATQRATLLQRQQAAAAAVRDWVTPVRSYRFSSPFGMRWGRLHAGNDFAAPVGTPLFALSSGTVILASTQSGYGNKIEIRFWDGTVGWYGHLSRIDVSVGDPVAPGQQIGAVGNTGQSTGPHLHLEIHPGGGDPVNPQPWLAARGVQI